MSSGYRYLEDIALSDAAFEAWGESPEELFAAAADATVNVMVQDLGALARRERREIRVRADELDLLLFELLQELIFYKDAECLLLKVTQLKTDREADGWTLTAEAWGDRIDPERHALLIDVKAVTLHRFRVWQTDEGWKATVVLDT
ncbi:MAG: archease [Deltaproteobacteria bacterium]|nr:archease [Deltaproteobacteria bacterium]